MLQPASLAILTLKLEPQSDSLGTDEPQSRIRWIHKTILQRILAAAIPHVIPTKPVQGVTRNRLLWTTYSLNGQRIVSDDQPGSDYAQGLAECDKLLTATRPESNRGRARLSTENGTTGRRQLKGDRVHSPTPEWNIEIHRDRGPGVDLRLHGRSDREEHHYRDFPHEAASACFNVTA